MKKIYLLTLISILIAGCQSNTERKSTVEVAKPEPSLAYKLATLEKDTYVTENDPIVKRFNNLLEQIDKKYDDVNKQQIGDMTNKLKEVAKERGLKVSMIKVMEGATQVYNLTYSEYLGSYLTLIEKGYNHDDAINSIKLLYGM